MKFTKIVGVATVVTLAIVISIVISNAKATPPTNIINLDYSTNFNDNYLIQYRDRILKTPSLNIANFTFDNNKTYKCKIRKRSMTENWINLLGRLIIIGSFTSFGVMSYSGVIERYIKLIFKDILPVFLIIFISISLLSVASVVITIYFSSSTSLTTSSNSRNTCILK